jgi:hypothetical protein
MQVEWKWCNELAKDNFKHKLYTTHNHWEHAPLPSLQYILCFSVTLPEPLHMGSSFFGGVLGERYFL